MVSRVTNIEAQTYKNKVSITALDKAVQERLNDKSHIIVEGGKDNLKNWSEHPFNCDPDFQEEFRYIISDEEVVEADYYLSPGFYEDTYLSMELAFPKRG